MATNKAPYLVSTAPISGHLADLRFETNGTSDPVVFSQTLDPSIGVQRFSTAGLDEFYRLTFSDKNSRNLELGRIHRVVAAVFHPAGDHLTATVVEGLIPSGGVARDTSRQIDVQVWDNTVSPPVAVNDVAIGSVVTVSLVTERVLP